MAWGGDPAPRHVAGSDPLYPRTSRVSRSGRRSFGLVLIETRSRCGEARGEAGEQCMGDRRHVGMAIPA